MELSVIIVNYNVKHFLSQCLHSIYNTSRPVDMEVIVVDNNSVDGSVAMLKKDFPRVTLIENKENLGFSKANNQAIAVANGENILLLNPDTVLENDTLPKCLDYLKKHPETGGLGVKMIDGKGRFLPESKRGLPTPWVAFYKMSGLAALFPKSKKFGKYHLSYLPENQIHKVDVLSGAFMMVPRKVIEKIGVLDETFFMYGEDIDFSYRILKAGYKNVYFSDARIIHYKGESTKKGSINYVIIFYKAMVIFARKHFSGKNANVLAAMINMGIIIRAFASMMKRVFLRIFLFLLDTAGLFGGLMLIKHFWEHFIIKTNYYYPTEVITVAFPIMILIWVVSLFYSGGYDKPIKFTKIIKGVFWGTVFMLVIYAILDESQRFSRGIIVLGAFWALLYLIICRYLFSLINPKAFPIESQKNKRLLIIGNENDAQNVARVIKQNNQQIGFIGLVSLNSESGDPDLGFIGSIEQLKEMVSIYDIDEIIFCARDLPASDIMDKMSELQNEKVNYRIAPQNSHILIGSNYIEKMTDLYVIGINSIHLSKNKRSKRLLDVFAALFFLIFYPVFIFFVSSPLKFLYNLFLVLTGYRTFVGYNDIDTGHLPHIKKGILFPTDLFKKSLDSQTIKKLNLLYSKDYKTQQDISIILKGIRNLGR